MTDAWILTTPRARKHFTWKRRTRTRIYRIRTSDGHNFRVDCLAEALPTELPGFRVRVVPLRWANAFNSLEEAQAAADDPAALDDVTRDLRWRRRLWRRMQSRPDLFVIVKTTSWQAANGVRRLGRPSLILSARDSTHYKTQYYVVTERELERLRTADVTVHPVAWGSRFGAPTWIGPWLDSDWPGGAP